MIKWLICLVFVGFMIPDFTAQVDKNMQTIDSTSVIEVDTPAQFPGGESAMFQFLSKQLVYPVRAKEEEISGKCFVQFVVTKEGLIVNVKVMRGVPGCPECDQECIRVIKSMPNWIPAQKDGKPVNSTFILPVQFKL
jgi:protein TonB